MSDAAQLKHTVADLRKEVDHLTRERASLTATIAALHNEWFALRAVVQQTVEAIDQRLRGIVDGREQASALDLRAYRDTLSAALTTEQTR